MKGLALVLWLAAIVLLANIVRMNVETMPGMGASVQHERSLLAVVAPTEAVQSQESVVRTVVAELVPAVGCSRLGIFPRRDWAERVAVILTDARAASAETTLAAGASSLIEEVAAKPWRVKQVSPDAYYLQFDGWSLDELAARMTLQRELLRKLLSITAIPEAC